MSENSEQKSQHDRGWLMEKVLEGDLKTYDLTENRLQELAAYLGLKIDGVGDRAGFDAVYQARQEVKKLRIAVEEKRKQLKSASLRYGEAVDSEAKRLTARLRPIEDYLNEQETAIVMEKQRLREEREREEKEKLDLRTNLCLGHGMVFQDNGFVLQGLTVSVTQLSVMTEEDFREFVTNDLRPLHDKIKADREEKERLEREYRERNDERKQKLMPYWGRLRGDQPSIDWGAIPQEQFDIIFNECKNAHDNEQRELEQLRIKNEELRKEIERRNELEKADKLKERIKNINDLGFTVIDCGNDQFKIERNGECFDGVVELKTINEDQFVYVLADLQQWIEHESVEVPQEKKISDLPEEIQTEEGDTVKMPFKVAITDEVLSKMKVYSGSELDLARSRDYLVRLRGMKMQLLADVMETDSGRELHSRLLENVSTLIAKTELFIENNFNHGTSKKK